MNELLDKEIDTAEIEVCVHNVATEYEHGIQCHDCGIIIEL